MTWVQQRRIGDFLVTSLTDGQFRLDGGAMYGTVPKVLWSRAVPADDANRIPLRVNPLLIQRGGEAILVESGLWDQGGEKFDAMYAVERDESVFRGLDAVGLGPDDIDVVVCTHLHFDHAGRNVTGLGEPTFPNARYVVQARELHDARHPHERSRASYVPATFEPLLDAGLFAVVEGEHELRPGVMLLPLPGHTRGMQGVVLRSGGQTLVYTADLLPTLHHAPLPYIMGFDSEPITTLETRKRYFPQWVEEGAVLCTPHDPEVPFARLTVGERGTYRAVPDAPAVSP
ncbi:glyoxylase-like metal-dependent hydrolase (beta-lactamase superfamily II) [Deinococcus metalli]|uniref:Glyoxylase-like metal-dependent hydrolase (Beta-lactamase superfamily II) n=1 Tax=Deinococcus metalli TaxID=1141878 RepID=A0A7W8NM50_9DEIO|nr:MBL fold metallo-hydrolase [Deinococcus metalli]MBB5375409.1 glyoxylase-like metal-dependent hydrolase (beta-lactamase superfamily II) [Deinococcus metalli]GHF29499.1 MBL fold metallo-hydrolase [Deinococcus metalli]